MILNQFLQSLVIQCWKFWNNGEKLFYDAPNEQLTLNTLNKLKQYKSEILRLLQENPDIFQINSALKLTPEQIKHFHNKGWLGPLDTFSLSEIKTVIDCLEFNSIEYKIDGKDSISFYNNIYNHHTDRDQHLFHKPIANLFQSHKIVQRLNQLGEPNLLLWRTNVFAKPAGLGKISWHQAFEHFATSNVTEKKSLVFPEDKEILNLTVWIALNDSTIENGCLRFANGSHKTRFEFINNCIPANEGVFAGINAHKSRYQKGEQYAGAFVFDENNWEVEAVPAKAGQIIIFTERCMHSSLSNQTNHRRIALNGRYINPSVQIYPDKHKGDFVDENNHNIEKHFSMLVSGKDNFKVNIVRDWNDLNEIELEFQNMFNRLIFNHVELPKGEKAYEIKSLYKQATEGDCQEREPSQDSASYFLWEAWKRKSGMSKLVAMKEYSQLIASLPKTNNKH